MTLKSMTAFGSAELQLGSTIYRCEIRSLNSRFCDISVKIPRSLIALEPQLISRGKERLSRGKVDIFLELVPADRAASLPRLNLAAVSHYMDLSRQLAELCGKDQGLLPLGTYEFLRLDGVLESSQISHGSGESTQDAILQHERGIHAVVDKAFGHLIEQRESEGLALGKALLRILDQITQHREAIVGKRDLIQRNALETYRKRLDRILSSSEETGQKVRNMLPEERLLSELAILADRSDIDEELTRLAAHEQEFHRLLAGSDDVGKRMDFLCQEMHREINTISSKLTQLDVAQHSLSLKQAVERIRQQVQNIE